MPAIEHVDAVIEEVEKLKKASAITEILYPNFPQLVIQYSFGKGRRRASGEFALISQT